MIIYIYTTIHSVQEGRLYNIFKYDEKDITKKRFMDRYEFFVKPIETYMVRNEIVKSNYKEFILPYRDVTYNTFDDVSELTKQLIPEIFETRHK